MQIQSVFFPREDYELAARFAGHSEDFIRETLAYADSLIEKNVPVIFSTAHLQKILDIDTDAMRNFLSGETYKIYSIKKRKGGVRWLQVPFRSIRNIQKWLYKELLCKIAVHSNAMGFCVGKSIKTNAETHLGQDFILNLDLKHFFNSITQQRVFGVYKWIGYHPNLARDLAKLCTTKPCEYLFNDDPAFWGNIKEQSVLPQGAPTSPILANLVAYNLDIRLSGYAVKNNLKYTRYADDITISGKNEDLPKLKIGFLAKIIQDEGFWVNWSKVRFFNHGSNKRIVTGVLVNGAQVRVPKKFKKEIWRHLFFCKKFGANAHLNRIKYYGRAFDAWLKGKILFVKSIEPKEGEQMLSVFHSIDWRIV